MAKIPATVVTGFLGAGKTSLVRHMIGEVKDKQLALIVNEFGEVGVDRQIVEGSGEDDWLLRDVFELANGCLCCTVADDFVPTIEQLLELESPPEHIIIETSGLALPKPLVKAFNWPSVRDAVTVDGVVTVVDTPAVASGMFAHDHSALEAQRADDDALDHHTPLSELFEDQIQCADLIVLSKCDTVTADEIAKARAVVEGLKRPAAKIVEVSHSKGDPTLLLGLNMSAEGDLDSRPSSHDDHHHHDHGHDHHDHDHHHHDHDHGHDNFDSCTLALGEISDVDALIGRLTDAVNNHAIYRIKGFVAVEDADARLLVQGVGARFDKSFDRDWNDGEERLTRLVVIGEHGLDQAAITKVVAE